MGASVPRSYLQPARASNKISIHYSVCLGRLELTIIIGDRERHLELIIRAWSMISAVCRDVHKRSCFPDPSAIVWGEGVGGLGIYTGSNTRTKSKAGERDVDHGLLPRTTKGFNVDYIAKREESTHVEE